MSGETARQESGWTVDTLKQHYDKLREADQTAIQAALVSQEKAVAAALSAAKEAVNKAETSAGKQFEAANNVKATFSGDLSKKLDRTEYDSNHKALEDKIDALTDRMNRNDGKGSGLQAGWGYLVGVIGVAATIIGVILAFNS